MATLPLRREHREGRYSVIIGLVVLAAVVGAIARQANRPAFRGTRIIRIPAGTDDPRGACRNVCESVTKSRCYDEMDVCERHFHERGEICYQYFEANPKVLKKYPCLSSTFIASSEGLPTDLIPCSVSCR